MKKFIIANWKMNPKNITEAKKLAAGFIRLNGVRKKINLVIAPPFVYFPIFGARFELAAQNAFYETSGAYTGEISPAMLRSLGIRHVILGHSERREYSGETDSVINSKVRAALNSGLGVVLCVGEKSRDDENFQVFVRDQLRKDLEGISKRFSVKIIIAYEPVWAIGTGKTVKPEDLYEITTYIRRTLLDLLGKSAAHRIPVLYGGSVNAKNSKSFLDVNGINGLLVGGASLDLNEFQMIIRSAT